jgi:hypothetical protein
MATSIRRGGRVVYGSGLENRRTCEGTVGSNPTLSAILKLCPYIELMGVSIITENALFRRIAVWCVFLRL